MSDFDQFREEVTWFVGPGDELVVGEPRPWNRPAIAGLPTLSRLLREATLTPVQLGGRSFELLAWGPRQTRRGWLGPTPAPGVTDGLPPTLSRALAVCGGQVERFGEPWTWWSNQNDVMTLDATSFDLARMLDDFAWLWEKPGHELTIATEDYVIVAVEANSNLTLAHRRDEGLVLFATDHSFDGVTPLPGSPAYSLMTIDAVPDLTEWIETCAHAWL